jgi:ribosomal protein L37E
LRCGSSIRTLRDFAEAGFDLVGTYQRSCIPVEVRCRTCGRESLVRLDNVRSGGTGCSWCNFDRLSAKFRLSEDEVEARAELARIRLLEPFASTHHAIRVECLECGYQPRRRINWSAPAKGCVRCGHRPFDFTAPSVLYLLHHAAFDALKVGVTNSGTNRLRDHRREGWEVAGRVKGTGEAVYLAERAVLGWWRDELELPPHVSASSMPQGGWTETVSASAVSIPDTLAFMREAVSASEVGSESR